VIQQCIYKILSSDITDKTPAQALSTLQIKYPGVTADKIDLYHYQSLMTLCGETDTSTDANGNYVWAKDHIKVYEKNYIMDVVDITREENTPFIIVTIDTEIPQNDQGDYQASFNIDIFTDPESDSTTLINNIENRIKALFLNTSSYSHSVPKKFIDQIPGMHHFEASQKSSNNRKWDFVRIQYTACYKLYLAII
jgi:hypothetical protein